MLIFLGAMSGASFLFGLALLPSSFPSAYRGSNGDPRLARIGAAALALSALFAWLYDLAKAT